MYLNRDKIFPRDGADDTANIRHKTDQQIVQHDNRINCRQSLTDLTSANQTDSNCIHHNSCSINKGSRLDMTIKSTVGQSSKNTIRFHQIITQTIHMLYVLERNYYVSKYHLI